MMSTSSEQVHKRLTDTADVLDDGALLYPADERGVIAETDGDSVLVSESMDNTRITDSQCAISVNKLHGELGWTDRIPTSLLTAGGESGAVSNSTATNDVAGPMDHIADDVGMIDMAATNTSNLVADVPADFLSPGDGRHSCDYGTNTSEHGHEDSTTREEEHVGISQSIMAADEATLQDSVVDEDMEDELDREHDGDVEEILQDFDVNEHSEDEPDREHDSTIEVEVEPRTKNQGKARPSAEARHLVQVASMNDGDDNSNDADGDVNASDEDRDNEDEDELMEDHSDQQSDQGTNSEDNNSNGNIIPKPTKWSQYRSWIAIPGIPYSRRAFLRKSVRKIAEAHLKHGIAWGRQSVKNITGFKNAIHEELGRFFHNYEDNWPAEAVTRERLTSEKSRTVKKATMVKAVAKATSKTSKTRKTRGDTKKTLRSSSRQKALSCIQPGGPLPGPSLDVSPATANIFTGPKVTATSTTAAYQSTHKTAVSAIIKDDDDLVAALAHGGVTTADHFRRLKEWDRDELKSYLVAMELTMFQQGDVLARLRALE